MSGQMNVADWSGERRSERLPLEEFDTLPRPIKALFWYAPFDYSAATAKRALQKGVAVRQMVQRGLDNIEADVVRESARTYGVAQTGWLA